MKCLHPILIKYRTKTKNYEPSPIDGYHEKELLVPCRKCPYCRRKLSLEWVRRLLHEYEIIGYNGSFVTLTYDPLIEPIEGVKIDHLQKFFKRLRKNNKGRYMKYYACGEYGEKNGHAHYHIILLGYKTKDKELIEKSWGLGIVDARPVKYQTAKYVVDYMIKNIPDEIINGRNKCFTLKSKGIGLKWFQKYLKEIIDDKCLTDNGHKVSIPRYYLKKLRDETITDGKLLYEYITEKNPNIAPNDVSALIQYIDNDYYNAVIQHNMNLSALADKK